MNCCTYVSKHENVTGVAYHEGLVSLFLSLDILVSDMFHSCLSQRRDNIERRIQELHGHQIDEHNTRRKAPSLINLPCGV